MFVSACVAEDPGAIFIQGNQRVSRQQQCLPQAAQGGGQQVYQTLGVMDLLQTNQYLAYVVVGSRLPSIEGAVGKSEENLQIETNEVTITGAWLTYKIDNDLLRGPYFGNEGLDIDGDGTLDLPGGLRIPESVYQPASSFIANAVNAVVAIELVPPSVGLALDVDMAFDPIMSAGYLSVEIVMEGYLTDGTKVHSTPYTFPIKVCRGCLVSYDITPDECCLNKSSPPYVPCYPGQDEASPCNIACDVTRHTVRGDKKMLMLRGEITSLSQEAPATDEDVIEQGDDVQ